MENLSQRVIDYTFCEGACTAGIATVETLKGGPPSTDLNYVMPGAKSAVVYAIPLDQTFIPDYLGKVDRMAFEENYERVNSISSGVAVKLSNFMTQKGHAAVPLAANDVYRDDTPNGRLDMLPPISLRYLAVASGVGFFGLSGNILTKENGGGVILGAVLTTEELEPTSPVADEDAYCDECRLCTASCASSLMIPDQKITVKLGGKEYSYADRRSYLRCQYVCGGFTGIHPKGKWSTWSPGRFEIPENDEDMLPFLLSSVKPYNDRPEGPGGHYHSLMQSKLYSTCANCQLICVADKEERKRRYKLLLKGGVVVQDRDGSVKAVSPDDAKQHLESMAPDVRALYEGKAEPAPELIKQFEERKGY
jgi:epoxyqueuosine reductase